MNNDIYYWAVKWGLPQQALKELSACLGVAAPIVPDDGKSETAVQQAVRLEASKRGVRLFRNNNGVAEDENGRPVRYGLANDSKKMNQQFKSSDLIGITPVNGYGVFTAIEMKKPGWKFSPSNEREQAQLRFINWVKSMGGIAQFATGPGDIWPDQK